MPSSDSWLVVGLACALAVAGACASREVPQRYPRASAASPDAEPARAAVVTRSLEGDPPWTGSTPSGGAQAGQAAPAHDHAHHGHAQPQPQASEPAAEPQHGAHHGQ